jgi:hypothetical protein
VKNLLRKLGQTMDARQPSPHSYDPLTNDLTPNVTFEQSVMAFPAGNSPPRDAKFILLTGVAIAILALIVPMRLPVGRYYWDIIMYLDVAYRVDHDQIPYRDFLVPFGPVASYGFWFVHYLLPKAQPVLAAQYAPGLLALLLLLIALRDIESRIAASVLAICLTTFTLLPFDFYQENVQTTIDAHGIYNRNAGGLLFVLITTLWWGSRAAITAFVIATVLFLLLFLKITAFAGAVALIAYMWIAGRLKAVELFLAAMMLVPVLIVFYAVSDIPSAYFENLRSLFAANATSTLRRMSFIIGRLAPSVITFLILFVTAAYVERRELSDAARNFGEHPISNIRRLARSGPANLLVLFVVGLLVETQNTGSQEFAFVIPAILKLALETNVRSPAGKVTSFVAAAYVFAFGLVVVERTVRIALDALSATPLQVMEAEPFRGLAKPNIVKDAAEWPAAGRAWPSFIDVPERKDFQVFYVMSVQRVAGQLIAMTSRADSTLRSIATVDFVDPFPLLTGIPSSKGLPVALDPNRTFSEELAKTLIARWRSIDGLIIPLCASNERFTRRVLMSMIQPVLNERQSVPLDECWQLYVKK